MKKSIEEKTRILFNLVVSEHYQPSVPPLWRKIEASPWVGGGTWRLSWRDRRENKAMSLDFGDNGGSAEFPIDIVIQGVSEFECPHKAIDFVIINYEKRNR